jgi:hypothetical protein
MGEPVTRKAAVTNVPPARKTMCEKCPFGPKLQPYEQAQADVLKARLAGSPSTLWGCHETAGPGDDVGAKTLLCAGFAAWRAPRPDLL